MTKAEKQTAPAETKTEGVKVEATDVVGAPVTGTLVAQGDDLDDLFAQAGLGLENTRAGDYAVPFLVVLQPLSPQVNKQNPDYVQGAEPGMIYNGVTKKLYNSIGLVPCEFRKVWVEWVTREGGGSKAAPVGEHAINSGIEKTCTIDGKKRRRLPNGNTLVETAYHYVLAYDEATGDTFQAVLSLDSTDLTPSRNWLTIMSNQEIKSPTTGAVAIAPTFSQLYKATQKFRQNDNGQWFNWAFEFDRPLYSKEGYTATEKDVVLRKKAQSFAKLIREGLVQVDRSTQASEEVSSEQQPAASSAAY